MTKLSHKKGFTLIEMLVVIAIIAVLVAVIIPTVVAATTKAKAATDAANLRSVLGEANALVYGDNKDRALEAITNETVISKSYPAAKMYVVYTVPGFVDVFYVDGTAGEESATYYGLDYFAELAETGSTDEPTTMPSYPEFYFPEWHLVGGAVQGE